MVKRPTTSPGPIVYRYICGTRVKIHDALVKSSKTTNPENYIKGNKNPGDLTQEKILRIYKQTR